MKYGNNSSENGRKPSSFDLTSFLFFKKWRWRFLWIKVYFVVQQFKIKSKEDFHLHDRPLTNAKEKRLRHGEHTFFNWSESSPNLTCSCLVLVITSLAIFLLFCLRKQLINEIFFDRTLQKESALKLQTTIWLSHFTPIAPPPSSQFLVSSTSSSSSEESCGVRSCSLPDRHSRVCRLDFMSRSRLPTSKLQYDKRRSSYSGPQETSSASSSYKKSKFVSTLIWKKHKKEEWSSVVKSVCNRLHFYYQQLC